MRATAPYGVYVAISVLSLLLATFVFVDALINKSSIPAGVLVYGTMLILGAAFAAGRAVRAYRQSRKCASDATDSR